ncbi:NAD-dependent epimerase/dehydratase family protein [Alkaliphilus peptidifermentans]|uniref:UDP-glucose 4-epimerase n=1 Tax=Alkaliphilus peptidifermentans DSM 18978 TaxID=1120976 RepID=A0A1G5AGY3_9FIRM|nr:NAD-dependent epimerase/dehydratase family protein [Alkaliphilus peptidifermentans]SCX77154.1 UDP-glucose 4-epimerase [Alkaliphilus peptidifermentans DSM 18978]
MKFLILGGTGFIGRNLIMKLSENAQNEVLCFSKSAPSLSMLDSIGYPEKFSYIKGNYCDMDFDSLTNEIDVVVHLISTTVPSNKNHILDLSENIVPTVRLLESCVKNSVKKFIFISSGGTVYGKAPKNPIDEDHPTNPICSYGVQKLTIEKYISLYHHIYGMDYKIIRLSNPYGKFQNLNSGVGAIMNFTVKSIKKEPIIIFGDGEIVRDYIYIDDAITGIMNVIYSKSDIKIFNLGSGKGTSLNEIIRLLKKVLGFKICVNHYKARDNDVPYNVLDIGRYLSANNHEMLALEDGIIKLKEYIIENLSQIEEIKR